MEKYSPHFYKGKKKGSKNHTGSLRLLPEKYMIIRYNRGSLNIKYFTFFNKFRKTPISLIISQSHQNFSKTSIFLTFDVLQR